MLLSLRSHYCEAVSLLATNHAAASAVASQSPISGSDSSSASDELRTPSLSHYCEGVSLFAPNDATTITSRRPIGGSDSSPTSEELGSEPPPRPLLERLANYRLGL